MSRKNDPLILHGIEEDFSDEDSKSILDEEYFKNCPPIQKINSCDIVEIKSKDLPVDLSNGQRNACQSNVNKKEKPRSYDFDLIEEVKEVEKPASPKVSQPKVNKPHTIVCRNIESPPKYVMPVYNAQTVSNISTRTAGSSIYSEILPVYSQISSPIVPSAQQRLLNDSSDNEDVSWCSCC